MAGSGSHRPRRPARGIIPGGRAALLAIAACGMLLGAGPAGGFSFTQLCFFEDGETRITPRCEEAVDRIAWYRESVLTRPEIPMVAYPDGLRAATARQSILITVRGHADDTGSPAWNDALSLRRASAVAAALERRGFAVVTMRVSGQGRHLPLEPGEPRLNRRVELSPF